MRTCCDDCIDKRGICGHVRFGSHWWMSSRSRKVSVLESSILEDFSQISVPLLASDYTKVLGAGWSHLVQKERENLSLVAMGGIYGLRMLTIACMCIFAMGTCVAATVPTSRPVGYSVTINSKVPTTVQVIATSNYVVSLEGGSPSCALTVRHFYSNQIAHLFWSATYYVGSLVGATKCTLTLTKAGDLQLFALFMGTNTMVWHSNTAGKGITHMALENVFDSGDFRLLTAANKIVWHSFGVPEFAILPTQKFTPGETLVAPSTFYNDSYNQILSSGGVYSLKLQSGDLRLYSNFGLGEKEYWSLHHTLFKGDLSKVAYAGIKTSVGGLTLFKADGSVVYTTGPLPLIGRESNPHDTYFSVDADGNLRTYYLVKGMFWATDFVALATDCDLPNFCGPYGVCSKNTTCSCPPSFKPNNGKDLTQGCKPRSGFSKCSASKFLRLTGYDYIYNQYATPLKVKVADCNSKCLKDCSCLAYFYDETNRLCYLSNEVRTLKKVSDNHKLAFIRL